MITALILDFLEDLDAILRDFATVPEPGSYRDGSRQVLKSVFRSTFPTPICILELAKPKITDHVGDPQFHNLNGFTYKILQNLKDFETGMTRAILKF